MRKTAVTAVVFALAITVLAGCSGGQGQSAQSSEPWSMDSDCGVCHSLQLASQDDAACLASKHVSFECVSCHSDEAVLSQVHADASAEAVEQASASEAGSMVDCRSCHDRQALVDKTEDILVKADGKSFANPHSNHVSVDAQCTDCHSVHEQSMLTCNECHDFVVPDQWLDYQG